MLVVLGTSAVAALAAAGPALADEVPLPEPPPTVEQILPETIPLPDLPPPELAEPPVVVATIDASNVDVSVRVLSPGEEPTEAQASETAVVSGEPGPDITAASEAADAPDEATPKSPDAINANVSVRILSPGDRGDVDQDVAGDGEGVVEAGARPSEGSHEPPPASPTLGDSAEDSAQYHDANSSSEYAISGIDDPWNWTWELAIDCAGNAASSSIESGNPGSLVWSWKWGWTWGCSEKSTPDSERAPPSSPQSPDPRPPDELVNPRVSTEASGEPWAWTWTFTFCGETTTISTNVGAGTPLTWTWDWGWTWLCPLTIPAEATPQPEVDAPPLPMPQPAPFLPQPDAVPDTPFPAVWLPSAAPELDLTTEVVVVPSLTLPMVELALDAAAEATVEVVIPAVVLPTPTTLPVESRPVPPAGAPEPITPPPSRRGAGGRTTIAPTPAELAVQPPQAEPGAHRARPAKQDRARGARPHRPLPPIPLDRPQPRQATGSSSFGGFVPSALLLGVAALTGFILLAAPGLGRRIRLARELSPRSLNESPLDRPG
jgi:hypothetical protein